MAALGLLVVGAALGSTAKAKSKTVAGPTTTMTATATVESTVTATPTVVQVIATHTEIQTITYTPPPPTSYPEGTYVVGTDIQPGTYHTNGGTTHCYWKRLSSLNTSDIIDNNISSGPQTVQVQPGDKAFVVSGDCTFTKTG